MHPTNEHPGYLLLFRGTDWHKELSPEEIQRVMADWTAWFERLGAEGKLAGANPLENEGRVLKRGSSGISDGPFAETKESIGGYFLLKVETLEEAVAIGRECPALPHGIEVEVRPVAPACPAERMAREVRAHNVA